MATNDFKPDVVMVQEVATPLKDDLLDEVNSQLDPTPGTTPQYAILHSEDTAHGFGSGDVAIVYNKNRLTPTGRRNTWPEVRPSNPEAETCINPVNGRANFAVSFNDRLLNRSVVVASVHTHGACITNNAHRMAQNLEWRWETTTVWEPIRRLTIAGGDFNGRPDQHGDTAAQGLETDPSCWYRRISAWHEDFTSAGESCPQNPTSVFDRYTDTVWVSAGTATNPAATTLCEQFTRGEEFGVNDPDIHDAANSCTDIIDNESPANEPVAGADGRLDKSRIDYIWASWENISGVAEAAAVAATRIQHATADLGVDPNPTSLDFLTNYSDHRAVQTLFVMPQDPT
ncbi:MAG: hypothetical protein ACRDKT_05020 [Actinomycetota bacterium]